MNSPSSANHLRPGGKGKPVTRANHATDFWVLLQRARETNWNTGSFGSDSITHPAHAPGLQLGSCLLRATSCSPSQEHIFATFALASHANSRVGSVMRRSSTYMWT
mmetsp:Transcript_13380/g.19138  ORF Transcript_13380/g.19138 Transcript_13380/m.19138 type:complete len:106 (+) Transcript_13380:2580-2897(+)